MGEISYRYVTIKHHIDGAPKEDDFEFVPSSIGTSVEPNSNHVLVKVLQFAIEPYQLNRMKKFSPSHSSIPPMTPGQPIDGSGVGRVIASGHAQFQKDDFVVGRLTWAEYTLVENGDLLRKIDPSEFPLSYHNGIFGSSGLTAYGGFFNLCNPKKGEKVFVSAASGSVGYLVGQYAKLHGCYVVGCAGTTQKVALLKEKLGFDEAFNYKEEGDLNLALKRYFPDGIDIYFDNVGGDMLEAAVANMNSFGRVAACGAISQYTNPSGKAPGPNMIDVIYKRITIRGFLLVDFLDQLQEFISLTSDYLRAGKIQVLEDISYGLESVPFAFMGLFSGRNVGKTIVQIADEK